MHYAHIVLIDPDDLPEITDESIQAKVAQMMAPYDENIEVEPYREYRSKSDIAAMTDAYETTDLIGLATRMEDWSGHQGGVDNKGLYQLTTYNPLSKWDWWRIGGRYDGEIVNQPRESDGGFNWSDEHEQVGNNSVLLKTIDHEVMAHSIITPDGEWHGEEQVYGSDWQDPYPYRKGVELTDKQRDANQQAWRDQHEINKAKWFAEKRELFLQYGHCIAVQVDYHM